MACWWMHRHIHYHFYSSNYCAFYLHTQHTHYRAFYTFYIQYSDHVQILRVLLHGYQPRTSMRRKHVRVITPVTQQCWAVQRVIYITAERRGWQDWVLTQVLHLVYQENTGSSQLFRPLQDTSTHRTYAENGWSWRYSKRVNGARCLSTSTGDREGCFSWQVERWQLQRRCHHSSLWQYTCT